MLYGRITGWGKSVPEKILTNHDLEKMVDTSDEWIVSRTGIRERHIAAEGETTATLSVKAAQAAMMKAGLVAADIDLIIVATSSPDYFLPPVSSMVQHQLGAHCGAFTLAAGCTGFMYGLATAQQFISTGAYKTILVIGAEIITRTIDWTDRNTCVLFGDGAGAVVMQACAEPTGVLSFELGSDGEGAEHLKINMGVANPPSHQVIDNLDYTIRMNGREVFKFATRVLARSAAEAIGRSGLSINDIDLFIPHQANARIIEVAAKQLGISLDKFFINLDKYGNTSAASIPIALCEAIEQGRCHEGDRLVMIGFGAGLTWASAVVQLGLRAESKPRNRRIRRASNRVRVAARSIGLRAGALLLPLYTRVTKRS
jgi:3-oxoacyl-[acyl-carrier-protein] synthase-3